MWGRINDELAAGLEVLALRQRLLAQNVANAETPGYKRYDLDFARALEAALTGRGPAGGQAAGWAAGAGEAGGAGGVEPAGAAAPVTGAGGMGAAGAGGVAAGPAVPGGPLPLAVTHPGHLPGRWASGDPAAAVYRETGSSLRNDGNNVDLDVEMARMAENGVHYQALVRQLSDRIALLRTVIAEGRR
ncbi:flagellar biosynthesis protein FlgB [Thermaerobacter sp. PB12/4term]|uniref:flagellar basal body rod protein FlgB n=1 Tax=Thermaerobacter sp. PB12/4term TaxID=2293838 RepID=UPI000E32A4E6|nr:flagellar biosynthesis protein FlgB [Thermaerobacter sp. PB12/4term]QIA26931.1 flagellar biosynthesis protein FlgB [Thermaerobacter sp. PB12/4term]